VCNQGKNIQKKNMYIIPPTARGGVRREARVRDVPSPHAAARCSFLSLNGALASESAIRLASSSAHHRVSVFITHTHTHTQTKSSPHACSSPLSPHSVRRGSVGTNHQPWIRWLILLLIMVVIGFIIAAQERKRRKREGPAVHTQISGAFNALRAPCRTGMRQNHPVAAATAHSEGGKEKRVNNEKENTRKNRNGKKGRGHALLAESDANVADRSAQRASGACGRRDRAAPSRTHARRTPRSPKHRTYHGRESNFTLR
jgi:hypothetical protein